MGEAERVAQVLGGDRLDVERALAPVGGPVEVGGVELHARGGDVVTFEEELGEAGGVAARREDRCRLEAHQHFASLRLARSNLLEHAHRRMRGLDCLPCLGRVGERGVQIRAGLEAQRGRRRDQPHDHRLLVGKGPAQELPVACSMPLPGQRGARQEQRERREPLHFRRLPRTRARSSSSGRASASSAPQPTQERPLRSRTARLETAPTVNFPSAIRATW